MKRFNKPAKLLKCNRKTSAYKAYWPAATESMARIYAGLGKKDEAFQWLEQAYREHWDRLPWIKIEPEYDSLRDDLRFSALLNKMGLDSRRTIAWVQ